MSVSLYRTYRPQRFQDVVGQEPIERTLCNAIAEDNVSHAYLFCGPRGTGKTTTARLLAKALLCERGPTTDPCGVCESCTSIAKGNNPDVYELDAASRTSVDNVRDEIIERVAFAPLKGAYKVYIIDEVHMLSTAAFNALLKTLEEPPSHVIFILCTTDPQKVPETILSRCQRFDFRRIPVPDIVENLRYICDKEGFAYDDASLELIAKKASGGMRDAITLLERWSVYGSGTITFTDAEDLFGVMDDGQIFDLVDKLAARDLAGCFRWIDSFSNTGSGYLQLVRDLTAHVRNLLVVLLTNGDVGVPGADVEQMKRYRQQANAFGGVDRLTRALALLDQTGSELRRTVDARLSVEVMLTRLARPDSDLTLESLAERVETLEEGRVATMPTPVQMSPGEPEPASGPARSAASPSASTEASPATPGSEVSPASPATPASQIDPEPEAVPSPEPAPAPEPSSRPAQGPGTQAPTSAPAPKTAPATSQNARLDEATVQRIWGGVLNYLRAHNPPLMAAYNAVVVKPSVDGGITVEFAEGNSFSKSLAEEPSHIKLLNDALEHAAGHPVRHEFILSHSKGSAAQEPAHAPEEPSASTRMSTPAPEGPSSPAKKSASAPTGDSSPEVPAGATSSESDVPAADDVSYPVNEDYEEDDVPPVSGIALDAAEEQVVPAQPAATAASDDTTTQAVESTQAASPAQPQPPSVPPAASASGQPSTEGSDADEAKLAQLLEQGFGVSVQLEEIEPDPKGSNVEEEQ